MAVADTIYTYEEMRERYSMRERERKIQHEKEREREEHALREIRLDKEIPISYIIFVILFIRI